MLGASRGQLARHVLIPSALSWLFSSLHITVGMAIVAVVVGEYLGASRGIGYLIAQVEGVFDTTGMFAGTALLAIAVLESEQSSAAWNVDSYVGSPRRIPSARMNFHEPALENVEFLAYYESSRISRAEFFLKHLWGSVQRIRATVGR